MTDQPGTRLKMLAVWACILSLIDGVVLCLAPHPSRFLAASLAVMSAMGYVCLYNVVKNRE